MGHTRCRVRLIRRPFSLVHPPQAVLLTQIMREVNFDGLVGPTFHFGGIAFGNLASQKNEGRVSNPRRAALQGLSKMRALHDLGVPQGIFPPHYRPNLSLARQLGFEGTDTVILDQLLKIAPDTLATCYSSAAMWTANAATVCPSPDALDGRVHFTPANLQSQLHRSIESEFTEQYLKAIFTDKNTFAIHQALPASAAVGDEGAANHTRFTPKYGQTGIQFFVYGESTRRKNTPRPHRFPARQTLEASEAIARLHKLSSNRTIFAQQNPQAIDLGVFHNDVISVGDRDIFFFHEDAFLDTQSTVKSLSEMFEQHYKSPLRLIQVSRDQLDLQTCVATYLFNSQIVLTADNRTVLIAPKECANNPKVQTYINEIIEDPDKPIDTVLFQEVKQSMAGGGGPACLRLRVALTEEEQQKIKTTTLFSDELEQTLKNWIQKHYRTALTLTDLADPNLIDETQTALDELTKILDLGSIYPFQL